MRYNCAMPTTPATTESASSQAPSPLTSSGQVAPSPRRLPSPAERPDADVVIYDGHCRICTAQIRKLAWWDCQGKLSYLSLHDPEVAKRYPDLTHERLMEEMVVVDRGG